MEQLNQLKERKPATLRQEMKTIAYLLWAKPTTTPSSLSSTPTETTLEDEVQRFQEARLRIQQLIANDKYIQVLTILCSFCQIMMERICYVAIQQ